LTREFEFVYVLIFSVIMFKFVLRNRVSHAGGMAYKSGRDRHLYTIIEVCDFWEGKFLNNEGELILLRLLISG